MARWSIDQEMIILDGLMGELPKQSKAPANQDVLVNDLRDTNKFPKTQYSDRSLLSKSRNVSTKAIASDPPILALFPEPAPKPEKPTRAQQLANAYRERKTMTAKQIEEHQALIDAARATLQARAEGVAQAKKTRKANSKAVTSKAETTKKK